ncbi:MAG: hypothetical protein P9L94_05800 [Candidatus Hinthialibacter antarcticus]|nr:hypothetical protein [Candidatus Hinthialibacter antarcticus]
MIGRLQLALDAAASLKDLKEVRDYARILTNLLQAHNLTRQVVDDASLVHINASREMGKYLQQIDKSPGVQMSGGCIVQPPGNIPTLKDLGIDKMLASRVQTLAKVGDVVFNRYIEEIRQRHDRAFAASA